jgi:transposase InsO family protein
MEDYRRSVVMKLMKLKDLFQLVDKKQLKLKEAAHLANYSYWHFVRLYKQYRTKGLDRLFKLKRKPRRGKLSCHQIRILITTYTELDNPSINLLRYFVQLDHPDFPHLSIEGLRKILIRHGVYDPGPRKRRLRTRFEAPSPGLLIQGDETGIRINHEDPQIYHLVMFIDDHSRYCLAARIVKHDTVAVHLDLHRQIIRNYGIYKALYYDNDEKYNFIRHHNKPAREANLQVRRALQEVGIEVINSTPFEPQGKGKVERALGTFQNFYAVFAKRYSVTTLTEANRILRRVRDYYNRVHINREIKTTPYQRFHQKERSFKNPPSTRELNRIFAFKAERKVARDNTISFQNRVYQLIRRQTG